MGGSWICKCSTPSPVSRTLSAALCLSRTIDDSPGESRALEVSALDVIKCMQQRRGEVPEDLPCAWCTFEVNVNMRHRNSVLLKGGSQLNRWLPTFVYLKRLYLSLCENVLDQFQNPAI